MPDAWLNRTMALIFCVEVMFRVEEPSALTPGFPLLILVDHPPLYMPHISDSCKVYLNSHCSLLYSVETQLYFVPFFSVKCF